MLLPLPLTAILLALSLGCTVLFGYMGARPMNPHKGPRMVPWRFMMMICFTLSLLLIVHLLTITGVKTDPPSGY